MAGDRQPGSSAATAASFEVELIPDVVYGAGGIGFTSDSPRTRALYMDVRVPVGANGPRPAIVLAFGGAFHRGDKHNDSFGAGEGRNTPVGEYAHYWAQRGFVTFSIDYRLVQEDPHPGTTVAVATVEETGTQRMDAVRKLLGLGPATSDMLWRGVEAASDDMACAARFVAQHAARWNVDPRRIALWGWSAGGRTALNAAFAERCPAAAVVACSGYMALADLERTVTPGGPAPSVLIATAERDLPHIRSQATPMAEFLRARLPRFASLTVADVDHFYPASSAVRDAGAWQRADLLGSMTAFLEDVLQ